MHLIGKLYNHFENCTGKSSFSLKHMDFGITLGYAKKFFILRLTYA